MAFLTLPNAAMARVGQIDKKIPSTGETIPAIGMGSWLTFDVGANQALRAQRTQVLKTFFNMGGTLIDSSPMYGSSQSVIGDGLQALQKRPDLFAADKVWTRDETAGPKQISQTTQRWKIEKFNLLQVHNLVNWQAHLQTLLEMKSEGQLKYVGVTSYAGLRYDEIEQIMKTEPIDFVQITYNLADREVENRILPLAQDKGIAVIANRPFRQGALIDYMMKRKLPPLAAEIGAQNWAQLLLKYIISHPAITVAIPATRRVDHMRENMGALTGQLPDPALRIKIAALI
ncbi:MAG: aldo/keto reductase [Acidimicrobiales bacterium]|nr:aldo/keto reductase [Hyphomonadaceae bacterium]RZV42905.1 MAG: aldo/keto reductase [Acidimicrobiales bacterium]